MTPALLLVIGLDRAIVDLSRRICHWRGCILHSRRYIPCLRWSSIHWRSVCWRSIHCCIPRCRVRRPHRSRHSRALESDDICSLGPFEAFGHVEADLFTRLEHTVTNGTSHDKDILAIHLLSGIADDVAPALHRIPGFDAANVALSWKFLGARTKFDLHTGGLYALLPVGHGEIDLVSLLRDHAIELASQEEDILAINCEGILALDVTPAFLHVEGLDVSDITTPLLSRWRWLYRHPDAYVAVDHQAAHQIFEPKV
mmetsp:Transcript_32292/g.59488  ORF Transcript_32292/g.59488 Transcript_32292/m.59488 type:complete len:256 (+) Transcript_32292:182-949(+)